jgi:hypothetical protein
MQGLMVRPNLPSHEHTDNIGLQTRVEVITLGEEGPAAPGLISQ